MVFLFHDVQELSGSGRRVQRDVTLTRSHTDYTKHLIRRGAGWWRFYLTEKSSSVYCSLTPCRYQGPVLLVHVTLEIRASPFPFGGRADSQDRMDLMTSMAGNG